MEEISPGLWHWTRRHPRIGAEVSSYYLASERVLIDPLIPPDGVKWFEDRGSPRDILLTNRHHDRDSWRLRERFGCGVHCVRNGVYELEGRGPVEPFDFGDRLPGGGVAYEIDAICPDETALYFPEHRALACGGGMTQRTKSVSLSPMNADRPDSMPAWSIWQQPLERGDVWAWAINGPRGGEMGEAPSRTEAEEALGRAKQRLGYR